MFTYEEKEYLLKLLKKENRKILFKAQSDKELNRKLTEKLEQMLRNERINLK
jgi:hypothetical protein